jgi:hypothetical protein
MARFGIFLTALTLIAGMVGCSGSHYTLTILSTVGGNVTNPGEGIFTYDEVTVVNLTAEADEGYYFVNWTGDVGTVGNVNAPQTIITTSDDYEITANFAEIPPNQFALTVSSTSGGSVIVPGEGTFIYDEGTIVNLIAEPQEDHQFRNWTGDVGTVADVNAHTTNITMNDGYSITANFEPEYVPMVAAAWYDTTGLKSDGTLIAVGCNSSGMCNVANWTDIVHVAAGQWHTVGLKSDGTMVAVGYNDNGQCDVSGWTDVVQVDAGTWHTVWVKADGTTRATGTYTDGQCDVGNWTNIIQVAGGRYHTVGLKFDGTVVAVGRNDYGECNVSEWTGIVQVVAGDSYTVGLKFDGTVVAVGNNDNGRCNVGGWTDITQVAAGEGSPSHTVGLKSEGTVVAVGCNEWSGCGVLGWNGIVQVAAGFHYTLGLKSDGTVVANGENNCNRCDVGDWDLN